MTLKRIGAGNRMSRAVIHGDKVYLAGYTPDKTLGMPVKEQTAEILQQIDAVLKQAGTDKTNIMRANIWLTDISTFSEMNSVWDSWVKPGETPARATVEAKLAAPGIDVEIMVEAAIPARKTAKKVVKKAAKKKAAKRRR
jgi:enamine deaminase RidA (YjgF/YER057c/UK114 family)